MHSTIIRNAAISDVEGLKLLNSKWQRTAVGDRIKDGFVGAAFSSETFQELISRKQIVVAVYGNIVVGYYLLNNYSQDGVIGQHKDMVKALQANGLLDTTARICTGAQAIVDSGYMGKGLRTAMLARLGENVKGRYDLLFATIAKDNPRALKAHTRDGWTSIGAEESLYYVVYRL